MREQPRDIHTYRHTYRRNQNIILDVYIRLNIRIVTPINKTHIISPLLFILVLEALSREFRTGVPWELLYADDLVIIAETYKGCIDRLKEWKAGMEQKGLRVNMPKTKILISGVGLDVLKDSGWFPCTVCSKGEGANSILCTGYHLCVHKGCSGTCSGLIAVTGLYVQDAAVRPCPLIAVHLCLD